MARRLTVQQVNRDSRRSINFGISYVLARAWGSDKALAVDFQKALLEGELDFAQANILPNMITLVRTEPSHLQIKLEGLGPQVSGLQVSSVNPQYELQMFTKEAAAACDAYQRTWLNQDCQIINSSARIQHLYSCREHAFQYLWEMRLGQSPGDFRSLGARPVAGGGLRLIMPPYPQDEPDPHSIEMRMESFLQEPRQLFVETVFTWPRPRLLARQERFDPEQRLETVQRYAVEQVWDFLTLKGQGNGL
jgi:hypothetical protein